MAGVKPDKCVKKVELKRELGLFSAVNFILAVMIGSGIFVSPMTALQHSGSVGLCLIIWISCGILSLMGALAFAELSTVVPRSGAEYAYFIEAFGPLHRFAGNLPAFICSWVYVMILRPAEVAVIVLTFAEYSIQPFNAMLLGGIAPEAMNYVKKLIGLLALGIITYINLSSVKLFVKVQNISVVCKVVACLIVIAGGIYWLSTGNTELLENPFANTTHSVGDVALAFYSGLWAYDGWSSAAIITEEVKKPEVNILRSIIIAVPIITVLYVSMNLVYMSALSVPEMINASAVAVSWAEKVLPGWLGFTIPLGVAISTFGCALSMQFGVSRLCYVAGREGHVPRVFSFIHATKLTPAAAVVFQGILSAFCIIAGDITTLIEFATFLIWIFYGLAMVALLVMRKTKPDANRPYRVPTFVAWIVLFVAIFLAIVPIITDPSLMYLMAISFVLVGVVVYNYFVYQKRSSKFSRKFTFYTQILCLVVAPETENTD